MQRLFYKKPTAILVTAMTVVLILLLCMLLINLTQLSSSKALEKRWTKLVEQAQTDEAAKQELVDYKNSDDYVKEWALLEGLLPPDVINYVKNLDSSK